jgi:TonB-linked SusC/RagA family outer membrane protein
MSEKTKNVRYALVGMLLLFCTALQAQTISGNVKDPTGEPVIGATVMEQGTQNGTVTDFDGNFTITLKGKSHKLVFSYVGMQNQTVDVAGKSSVNVNMKDDAQMLDEVVAIGYGTVRKKDLTGAVAQVGAKQIENIPVTDVSQALQGKMSGVNVTVADGAPDAESTIRVRGGGSLSQDNSPLYIVDGFEVADISDIAPSEIETIDVLKDASSTAIYGAKGANGVIIVTTKSGTDARIPKINFNASWSWKKAAKFQKVLSPYDYAMAKYEMTTGSTNNPTTYGKRNGLGFYNDLDIYKSVAGMDYQDEIFGRTGFQQMYNVNIAGGTKILQYNVTYAHDDQDAIMLNSGSSKNNISGKLKWKPNKYIAIDASVRLSYQKVEGLGSGADTNESNAATSIVANSVAYSPIAGVSIDDDDDELQQTNTYSPLQRLLGTYKKVTNNKQTYNIGFTWKPWKHWSFKTEFSYNHNNKITDQVWTAEATTSAKTYKGSAQSRYYEDKKKGWTSKNYVTYDNKKLFGGRDNINVVAGFDIQSTSEKTSEDFRAGYDYRTTDEILAHRGEAANFLPIILGEVEDDNMKSFYGRLNYIMKEKYLLTFTMRADGSSKFAKGNHWGFFPAGSLAWRVSDEKFLKDSKWISNLKLRLSLGMAGNNRIKSGLLYTTYSAASNSSATPYFTNDVRSQMYEKTSTALYNDNLKWETTITRNFGIDYGFWKGRINGSLELYWNTTKDLLMAVTIPANSGSTTQYQNFGKTSNKGVELSSNIVAYDSKKFTINANFNVAYNRNKIEELSEYAGQWQSSNFAGSKVSNYEEFKTVAGGALGEVWGYQTDGFYTPVTYDADGNYVSGQIKYNGSSWELDPDYCTNESYKSLGGILYPGQLKLKDADGDNSFDLVGDKVKLGNTIPTWTGGFGGDATWKNTWGNIDATIFFNFALGHQILNGTRLVNSYASSTNMSYNLVDDFRSGNYYSWIDPATGYNLGRPNSDVITYYGSQQGVQDRLAEINAGRTLYSPVATTKMLIISDCVEDASFLRLQNVTVGYSFPKKFVKKIHLSNLRVYFTGYNLACWTKYSGADPEVDVCSKKNPMCPGVDYSAYPKTRSFVAGLNVSF